MKHEKPCKQCGATIWYGILHVCNQCPWCEKPVTEKNPRRDSYGRTWHKSCAIKCSK